MMLPRSPAIKVIAIITGLFLIGSLAYLMQPQVVYVDSKTNEVLGNYDPVKAANDQVQMPPSKPEELKENNSIKDNDKEAKLAEEQLEHANDNNNNNNNNKGDLVVDKTKTNGLQGELQTDKHANPQEDQEPIKATFVTLARNEELYELIKSVRRVEDRFNRKFNYDWVFLNDVPFTEEFKDLTTSIVSGKTKYGVIPKEHWSYPDWVDLGKAAKSRADMKNAGIIYGDLESYRHMCRFESGFFWRNELLEEYDWYWRVEPGIQIHCDLEYDLFRFMKENKKKYGFTISIHEFVKTIPTLWDHTKEFMKLHPEYLAKDNLLDFISDDKGETYNLCHFWSNFEIADLNFWRSDAYREYFDYLDKTGGFFYERWGDAPVHSIAAALFLNKDEIHYFEDVGYNHGVYTQCPLNAQFRYDHKCHCDPQRDFTFRPYSCGKKYYDVMNLERPAEWVDYQ